MRQFVICPNCGLYQAFETEKPIDWGCCCGYMNDGKPVKAISIKQPWTYLIAAGIKPIENRTWPTKYRGPVLLHAGAKPVKMINPSDVFTREQWESFSLNMKTLLMCTGTSFKPLSTSAIIGTAEIVDCVRNHASVWAEKDGWNWVMEKPVLFEKPVLNVKGRLSFFVPEIN